ncbi:MAG: hypothetical protein ABIH03_05155 [Pseudomonadota bacterium]
MDATRADVRNAKKVLDSLRGARRNPATDRVARACRRILDGKATPDDLATLRAYAGWNARASSGGASRMLATGDRQIRGVFGKVTGAAGAISSVTREIDIASSGGSMATARLGQTVADVVADSIKKHRKAAIAVGDAIVDRLGMNPQLATKLVTGIFRVARMGGAIGMIAGTAAVMGIKYFGALQRGELAESKMRDVWWRLNSRSRATANEIRARGDVESARVLPDTGLSVIDDLLHARASEAAKTRVERLAKITEARRAAQLFGGARTLGEAGLAAGGGAEALTKRQLNRFLDERADKKRIGQATKAEKAAYMDARWRDLRMGMPTWLSWLPTLEEMKYGMFRQEYVKKWELEAEEIAATRDAKMRKEKAEGKYEKRERMSETDKRALAVRTQEAQSSTAQYQSRHQAVIPD